MMEENNRQYYGNIQKHEQSQEIGSKFLSTKPNLHTNCHFKNINQKWSIIQEASGPSTATNTARRTSCKAWNTPAYYYV